MAKVSDFFLFHLEEDDIEEDNEESSQSEINFEAKILDHAPYWSASVFDEETLIPSTPPIFSPAASLSRFGFDDQAAFNIDLFERSPPPETLDTSDFGVLDEIEFMACDYLGEQEDDRPVDHGEGLRVVGFGSDSESESDPYPHDQDPNLSIIWDSLRIEEDRGELVDDFEWEEVDCWVDERDFLSMMVGERPRSSELDEDEEEEEEEDEVEGGEARNVDWEFFLAVRNVAVEDGDFINPSEYEVLFEQFVDHDSAIRGTPPSARSVVDNLPMIVLTQEDVVKNNAICANYSLMIVKKPKE